MEGIRELAKHQLSDYDGHQPGALFADGAMTITLEQAYALQIELAHLRQDRGERVAGYKIGCISQAVRVQLGLDRPVFGHIYETELRHSGVVLDSQAFDGLAIEGELAVRLAEDIADSEWLRTYPNRAIAGAFAVIELHNYSFRDRIHSAQELIGNNAMHAGVVLPLREPPIHDPDGLLDEPISVRKNGDLLGTSTARALQSGPLDSLGLPAEHLSHFGGSLCQGQIVLTGSSLPLYRVAHGDYIEVVCRRLGGVITATIS